MKIILIALLPFLAFFSDGYDRSSTGPGQNAGDGNTGTLEKMIAANGSVVMDLSLKRFNGSHADTKAGRNALRFDVEHDSFFTVLVFNDELRGPLPSSMRLIPRNPASLPTGLNASSGHLVIESLEWGGPYELAVRDEKTGFVFFNIEGHAYNYDASGHLLNIDDGRLLISKEFAAALGRRAAAGSIVGKVSIQTIMRPIEVTQFEDGEVKSDILPS